MSVLFSNPLYMDDTKFLTVTGIVYIVMMCIVCMLSIRSFATEPTDFRTWWQVEQKKPPEAPKVKKIVKSAPAQKKVQEPTKEKKAEKVVKAEKVDMKKLAKAIAMAETLDCTKWYWKQYNNCFGIKNGNTAPCKKVGRNRMCIYDKKEDSYKAFEKVWTTWYKTFPTPKQASIWTGADHADTWLKNVEHHYNK